MKYNGADTFSYLDYDAMEMCVQFGETEFVRFSIRKDYHRQQNKYRFEFWYTVLQPLVERDFFFSVNENQYSFCNQRDEFRVYETNAFVLPIDVGEYSFVIDDFFGINPKMKPWKHYNTHHGAMLVQGKMDKAFRLYLKEHRISMRKWKSKNRFSYLEIV